MQNYPQQNTKLNLVDRIYPENNANNIYEDGEFRLTFDTKPDICVGCSIEIYKITTDTNGNTTTKLADSIKSDNETQTVWDGISMNVEDQLIRIDDIGNVFFTPHHEKLENGATYFVAISDGAFKGLINKENFTGLSNTIINSKWKFTIRKTPKITKTITVNSNENAKSNFRTLGGALRAIGSQSGDYTIELAKGTYYDLPYFHGKANITISGKGTEKYGTDVTLSYANANCLNSGMKYRDLFYFCGGNLVLENLTLKNTFNRGKWGETDGQAETISFYSGKGYSLAAFNCSFLSHQDTIYTTGKAWFYKCKIEGDTDYIWGISTVCLIENCKLVSLYDKNKSNFNSYILVSRTPKFSPIGKGYVIFNSDISSENGETIYYGRNANNTGFFDQCAVIKCTISGSLAKTLWYDRNKPFGLKPDINNNKHVGWKDYKNTINNVNVKTTNRTDESGIIDDTIFHNEYSSRDLILNRCYDINSNVYTNDIKTYWDINTFMKKNKWK